MTTPRLKSFTWRLSQIPEETSKDDILNYFDTDDRERIKVISLYPDASELGKLTATLLFKPNPDQPFDSPKRLPTAPEDIEIDKEFEGLTTLYCPPRGQVIAADVIAITGLTGHAFGSWAKSENFMWLRDFASKFGPSTRVLTYGYDTRLEGIDTSMTILADQAKAFLGQIKFSREARKCQKRPIIFIGHSLGCLLIKRAMVEARDQYFALPVHAIIFMAAPHRGMNIKALEALVQGEPPQTLVRELERGSPTLQDLAERFPRVLGDIPVLTVFETKKTQTVEKAQEPYALIISDFGLTECQGPDGKWVRSGERVFMVESHSAKEYSQNERQICSNENHSSIAKLARNSNNIVFNSLRAFIAEILPKSIDALDSAAPPNEPVRHVSTLPAQSPIKTPAMSSEFSTGETQSTIHRPRPPQYRDAFVYHGKDSKARGGTKINYPCQSPPPYTGSRNSSLPNTPQSENTSPSPNLPSMPRVSPQTTGIQQDLGSNRPPPPFTPKPGSIICDSCDKPIYHYWYLCVVCHDPSLDYCLDCFKSKPHRHSFMWMRLDDPFNASSRRNGPYIRNPPNRTIH